jgi:hypothetical protein
MEPNELMTNEDVIKTTVEVTTEDSGNGFGMAVVGGLVVLGSISLYKYVLKPIITKLKSRREKKVTVNVAEVHEVDFKEVDEEAE